MDQSVGGQAFGYRGAYAVALSGGLVRQFYRQRSVFRGVVLHELAHIHNGDVDKTYFALALAAAFVVVALAPFAVSIALPWTSPDPGRTAGTCTTPAAWSAWLRWSR